MKDVNCKSYSKHEKAKGRALVYNPIVDIKWNNKKSKLNQKRAGKTEPKIRWDILKQKSNNKMVALNQIMLIITLNVMV